MNRNNPISPISLKKILFLFLFFFTQKTYCYEHELAICTIFKNNASFFKEWIEYHRMVGVTHFYLFDNSSEDHPYTVLKPYIEQKIVTRIDWPNRKEKRWKDKIFAWVRTTQKSAYHHAIQLALNKVKWLALIDCDEFLVPMQSETLLEFLNHYKDEKGLKLNWMTYGTSEIYDIPENCLMVELLNRRAPIDHEINLHTKCIVKPEWVELQNWLFAPHEFPLKDKSSLVSVPIQEARINHYINRTIRFFFEQKVSHKRLMDNSNGGEHDLLAKSKLYNDEEDYTMDRFIPTLKEKMYFPGPCPKTRVKLEEALQMVLK